jgi:hypothetical protein
MSRKNRLRSLLIPTATIGLLVATSFNVESCGRDYVSFESHPVDDAIPINPGYELRWVRNNSVLERQRHPDNPFKNYAIDNVPEDIHAKFYHLDDLIFEHDVIVRYDLDPNSRGYANIIHYEERVPFFLNGVGTYVELHLPIDQKLKAGIECYDNSSSTKKCDILKEL